jgi:hypothetical protein
MRAKVERRVSKRSAGSALNPNPFLPGQYQSVESRASMRHKFRCRLLWNLPALQQRLAWSDFNMGQAAIGHKSKIGIILTAVMPQDNPFIFNCNLEGSRNMANPECGMAI